MVRGRSKTQRRIEAVLASVPLAREQLLVAVEDLAPSASGFADTAASGDPRERNRLAVVGPRQLDRFLDGYARWLEDLGLFHERRDS